MNFAPEELGIGKYSGEMVEYLMEHGHDVTVVTTPPYYPQWKIASGFSGWRYHRDSTSDRLHTLSDIDLDKGCGTETANARTALAPDSTSEHQSQRQSAFTSSIIPDFALASLGANRDTRGTIGKLDVIRCPIWVPSKVTGLKRIVHLATFGLSSVPVMLWKAISFRPDVVMTVEPAAMCMPTTLFAARFCRAKTWLHVQDFEIAAAFDLGILKQPLLQKLVLGVEGFLMRRFNRVSSISPNMLLKLVQKGVDEQKVVAFPNWVDCDAIRPLNNLHGLRDSFGIPDDKCICLYSGNLGAKQGLEVLLEAAEILSGQQHIQFLICGDGANRDRLQASAGDLDNVQWLPLQPFERLNDLLNCADIHLLPQRSDAADLVMPSKLTGMLASGRPVVACAHSGTQIADVVEGLGAVVPPGDARAVADAINSLAGNRELRKQTGDAAREYAVNHLSREAILSRFTRELESLADVPRGGRNLNLEEDLITHESGHDQPERAWRSHAITAWVIVAICLAAFFLLRPDPRASNVAWLPKSIAALLDKYYDGRTFLMTAGVVFPICIFLHTKMQDSIRRVLLGSVIMALLVMEFAQNAIPNRSFSVVDLGYTLLAGVIAEATVVLLRMLRDASTTTSSDESLSL
ncbi:glycosyltransferase WbuB [Aporhodopirellula aestuarii]|uniref:Glycosyltransferase WbuB n=1 Tax=Aporhodopirellula aestuarii TaxID=2950107 RepID=A0ABT0U412_9BACT|nr:glycosyltransferase WbuB [Aporhodopirellula aestuarii]MCM2371586.1 glycosyltransferase WbuB [Aporhodopirellula aestuarii]